MSPILIFAVVVTLALDAFAGKRALAWVRMGVDLLTGPSSFSDVEGVHYASGALIRALLILLWI